MLFCVEKQMQVIEPLPDFRFQFALDPLAEYLGALYIVEQNNSDANKWNDFVMKSDAMPGAPVETVDFLTAMADSIRWKADLNVPANVLDLIDSLVAQAARKEEAAGHDPWDAWTLEWATSSPPPEYNFEKIPVVRSSRPLWDLKHPHDPDWKYE
jgi:hypothetical protein